MTRSYTRLALAIVAAALIAGSLVYASSPWTTVTRTSTVTTSLSVSAHDTISVSGLSICPSDCIYPAPYVSGQVLFNASAPVSTLTVYVNDTYDGMPLQNASRTLTVFVYEYKGSVPGSFVPVVPGDTYIFTFVAVFQDGSAAVTTASVTVNQTQASTSTTSAEYVTGTSVDTSGDTYLTTCSVTGIGGFQLMVASDSTDAPVTGETVNAVDTLGCDIVSEPTETQTVYLDNFSVGQGGWLSPVFPSQAEPGGKLFFTIEYEGNAYSFTAVVPAVGTSCVTLHVPSGNVTTATSMNGGCP